MVHLFKSQLFRRQFLSFSVVLIFLTILLLGAVSLKTRHEFSDRQDLFAQLYRDQLSDAINGWLIAQISNAQAFAKLMENREDLGSPAVTRMIQEYTWIYTETADILIIDSNGFIVNGRDHSPSKPYSTVLKDREYVHQALEKGLGIMGFSPGRNTGNLVMTVAVRFLDRRAHPHVAAIFVRLDKFSRMVNGLSTSNLGQVYLIDPTGKLFVMGKKEDDQLCQKDLQLLRSTLSGVGAPHTVGGRVLPGAHTWVGALNVGLLVSLHGDILMKPLQHLQTYIIWLALTAIIFSTFFSFLIASQVYKPIQCLVRAVNSAAEQNYEHNIEPVRDRDLNALIEGFNRMRQLIAVRETTLIDTAQRDSLTRLFNHGAIVDQLEGITCSGDRFCVAMVDIDHFKKINDTYGHLAGDYVLVELSTLLSKNLRTQDLLGRYGGEEFLLILRGKGDISVLFERLRGAVEEHVFTVEGTRIPLTISVGWVGFEKTEGRPLAMGAEDIIAGADRYLYQAKAEGRNRVRGGGIEG